MGYMISWDDGDWLWERIEPAAVTGAVSGITGKLTGGPFSASTGVRIRRGNVHRAPRRSLGAGRLAVGHPARWRGSS